ncbi:hypothetical protein [Novosphingobium guangzhouense]|uniref:Uncharacterized protein n=1 Tax=Novosphingobium guangzhouense TaxID=1850347 RepID=A0A2K2FX94_9SPHN|nr:hypothetical protein [Novosphingobium guangzhouense]PNU03405.1 hypothetical protein A8V01_06720 [Novosphingobium guangzhouense]
MKAQVRERMAFLAESIDQGLAQHPSREYAQRRFAAECQSSSQPAESHGAKHFFGAYLIAIRVSSHNFRPKVWRHIPSFFDYMHT